MLLLSADYTMLNYTFQLSYAMSAFNLTLFNTQVYLNHLALWFIGKWICIWFENRCKFNKVKSGLDSPGYEEAHTLWECSI